MTENYYKVINIPPKTNNAPNAERNLKNDAGNMIVNAQETWLTIIWHYPFTKKYSNKYLTNLYLFTQVFSKAPEHCGFSCKMEEKQYTRNV